MQKSALVADAPRDIVRTAKVDVRAADVDRTADEITQVAAGFDGRIDEDNRETSNGARQVHLVVRVPAAALDPTLHRIDSLGKELSRTVTGQDMTATRADLNARTAALATSVARLRQLLSHSGSVADLVALEQQLTQREADLESMQAQQRALADRIALATLTVEITVPVVPAPASRGPAGFGAAFVTGWHAVLLTVRWLLAVAGYALPLLIPLALVAGAIANVLRRHRRRTLLQTQRSPQHG